MSDLSKSTQYKIQKLRGRGGLSEGSVPLPSPLKFDHCQTRLHCLLSRKLSK